MEQLKRLCEVDPEHFRWKLIGTEGYGRFITPTDDVDGDEFIDWNMAGWMLEQMQKRNEDYTEFRVPNGTIDEYAALKEGLSQMLYSATPELITSKYIAWKECAAAQPAEDHKA